MNTLEVDLPVKQRSMINKLVDFGHIGNTPEEVARFLVTKALDDYIRAGVFK